MFRKTTRMLRTQRLMEDVRKSEIDVKTRFVRGVGGNTACASVGGIGEDGLSFVGSVQQCRFGGRAVGVGGAWLAPSAAGAYPHRTWLDTCATKTGTGVRAAREHNDWRST